MQSVAAGEVAHPQGLRTRAAARHPGQPSRTNTVGGRYPVRDRRCRWPVAPIVSARAGS
jgi:hypothetical protein